MRWNGWLANASRRSAIELRDTDRELVEHRALRLAEGAEGARLLFHLLDVDGVAGDAFLAQRQVADPQGAALAADRGLHDPLDRQVLCRAPARRSAPR